MPAPLLDARGVHQVMVQGAGPVPKRDMQLSVPDLVRPALAVASILRVRWKVFVALSFK